MTVSMGGAPCRTTRSAARMSTRIGSLSEGSTTRRVHVLKPGGSGRRDPRRPRR